MKRVAATAEYEPASIPIGGKLLHETIDQNDITISCYENDVPSFVADDMERLYENVFSSLAQYRIYNDDLDTHTYIARKGGKIVTVFLFRCERATVRVMNEGIVLNEEDVARFAYYVFSRFPAVSRIAFRAVRSGISRLPFPHQRVNHLEDIVLALPDSAQEYLEQLGKGMRRKIRRHAKNLSEKHPSYQYRVYVRDDIDPRMVEEIVSMNHARMAGKNKMSAIDHAETDRIFRLARACGLVGVVKIDGRICAGTISYRAGSNYFLHVIAHDPCYDDCLLGILCCYFTICECIERGGREFHFLWGRYDYKFALRGVRHDLDNLMVYRSRTRMLLNADKVMYTLLQGALRKSMLWLHNAASGEGWMSRFSLAPLQRLKQSKQSNAPPGRT